MRWARCCCCPAGRNWRRTVAARAVAAEKTSADYRLDYGQCLLVMGRVSEAAAQYRARRALAPRKPQGEARLGSYLLGIGRGEEALAAFDAALAAGPRAGGTSHPPRQGRMPALARQGGGGGEGNPRADRLDALPQPLRRAAVADRQAGCRLSRIRPDRARTCQPAPSRHCRQRPAAAQGLPAGPQRPP